MKKLNLKPGTIAILFFALMFSIAAVAQTNQDSLTNALGLGPITLPKGWLPYVIFVGSIYEAAARLYPTVRNYSIAGWLIKGFQYFFPNRNAKTPTDPHP